MEYAHMICKNLRQKIVALAIAVVGIFLLSVPLVYAFDPLGGDTCQGAAAGSSFCQNVASEGANRRITGPGGFLTVVAQVVVFVVGAVSVIMVIIGGLRYVLSGGDGNGTKGAKDTIMYALIGLAVAIFSQVIVTFVLAKL